ncbi:MAG TPA: efflux RND transporter periplasmic adaptor subunit [Polyangiales bacterium]|nr:efflux RND transporter periplasmic adaptor subunit [Polyangiales bacterium]
MRMLAAILITFPLIALASGVARDAHAPSVSILRPAAVQPAADSGEDRPALPIGGIGVVVPSQATDVGAPYAGRLRAVHVRLGDHVEAGGVIASLATELARHDLEMATAAGGATTSQVRRATLELSRLEDKVSRLAKLAGAQLATEEELAEARFDREARSAQLEQAQAELAEKRAHVAQLTTVEALAQVRAPFSGTIASRYLDAGATVGAGQAIVRIIEDGAIRVRFAVREVDAQRIMLGARIIARSTSAPDAPPLIGVVDRIAPEVDASSRTLFAEATTPSEESAGARLLGAIVSVIVTSTDLPRSAGGGGS